MANVILVSLQDRIRLERLQNSTVVLADGAANCIHFQNCDKSIGKKLLSDDTSLNTRRMHCNDTFLVVALKNDDGQRGGYSVRRINDLNMGAFVDMMTNVFAIYITMESEVALGCNGDVHLHQLDLFGKHTKKWSQRLHTNFIRDITVRQDKVITVSADRTCGLLDLSNGAVLFIFKSPSALHCVCVLDNDNILTGAGDGKLYLHCISAKESSAFVQLGTLSLYSIKLSADSHSLYCGGADRILYAIDTNSRNILWKTQLESSINSIWEQDDFLLLGLKGSQALFISATDGKIISKINIKSIGEPWGVVMIPKDVGEAALSPVLPLAKHNQILKDEIENLKAQQAKSEARMQEEIKSLKNESNIRGAARHHDSDHHSSKVHMNKLDQQVIQLTRSLELANQQILALKAENDKFKAEQSRLQVNAFVSKINTLSGPEVARFASFLNINVTGIDSAKLDASSMLAHGSFDEFFEAIDVDPELHDCLLRLYSVVKKTQETGQLPVEHAIAPWIAKQDQDGKIAGRFAELQYTEEMMTYLDAKLVAHRTGIKASVIKKLQADFIASQYSVMRLVVLDQQKGEQNANDT